MVPDLHMPCEEPMTERLGPLPATEGLPDKVGVCMGVLSIIQRFFLNFSIKKHML